MKKDIFSTWVREFCSLVFMQTIQAFIFSIIMILIVSVMTPENVYGADRSTIVSSTGFMAVIALASISKVEDLVKKIFGVQSSVTDPSMRGGMKSLASTLVAAKLAKGVLDNGKKVVGGTAGVLAANRKMRLTKARYARDISRKLGSDNNSNNNNNNNTGNQSQVNANNVNVNATDVQTQAPTARDYMAKAIEAKNAGNMEGYYMNKGIAAGINKANNNLNAANTSSDISSPSSNRIAAATAGASNDFGLKTNGLSNKEMADLDKLRDTYQDKMNELKSQRMDSAIKLGSGFIESAGAIVGATGGALSGAALGDVDDIIRNGLAGIGAGDAIGSIPGKVINGGRAIGNTISAEIDSRKQLTNQMQGMSETARKNINARRNVIARYDQAKKEFNRMQKQVIDAGNLE